MRPEKKYLVEEARARLAASGHLFLVSFTGVTVADAASFRRSGGLAEHAVNFPFAHGMYSVDGATAFLRFSDKVSERRQRGPFLQQLRIMEGMSVMLQFFPSPCKENVLRGRTFSAEKQVFRAS